MAVVPVALLAGSVALAKKMTSRQVIDRWFEIIDSKKTENFPQVEHADLQMKTPMGLTKGSEGHVQMTKGFAAAFPNFKHTITQCIESGDMISCEGTFAGDHTGPMMMPNGQSIPATGKHVQARRTGARRQGRRAGQDRDPLNDREVSRAGCETCSATAIC